MYNSDSHAVEQSYRKSMCNDYAEMKKAVIILFELKIIEKALIMQVSV